MKETIVDYIVVGSGIAGLTAANRLADHGTVAIVSKSEINQSATRYAQGGIAVAMRKDDAPAYHFKDTIDAGDGLCQQEAVRILVDEGPERVKELISFGTSFDRNGKDYDFTKEGAHQKRRILHAGDATGREIETSLRMVLTSKENVTILQHTNLIKILQKEHRYLGCIVKQVRDVYVLRSRALIIATGGCGQLFSHNTNPSVVTGDGIALAFNAGCRVQDMSFMQFHPTTLHTGDKKPISIFLISEAVRGEGAVLRNCHGERFMPRYHKQAELASRDVVSRAIIQEMAQTKSTHVYLDLSELRMDIEARFPTIYRRCLESHIDIKKDFIPVSPAAHYFMGGIQVDLHGKTDVDGIYAIGEVANNGVHGANRLASNSLLDGLVFGHRAAIHMLAEKRAVATTDISSLLPKYQLLSKREYSRVLSIKQKLRDLMWQHVGIVRHGAGLRYALKELLSYRWVLEKYSLQDAVVECQNMIVVAGLMTQFALVRKESRGAHYRQDYPHRNDAEWAHNLVQSRYDIRPKYTLKIPSVKRVTTINT